MTHEVRQAEAAESDACAAIHSAWIDEMDWVPRVHSLEDMKRHYKETVFKERIVFVSGSPVAGFLSLDREDWVTALFCRVRGAGIGKALMDRAKQERDRLRLWTFVANAGGRRFYSREGFREVDRSDGDNEEALPDIQFEWTKGGPARG